MKELAPRDRVGPYEIAGAIGAGGMGKVFRARDLRLGRDVALKVLPAEVAGQPERLARFRREAQILASLNHPRIAAIHGLEEADGILALSLELVEGEDLSQRLARGALPVEEALEIAGQIAAGLEYAHEHGVVHRDLKPANVKTTPDGGVKILDFGLAKAYDSDPADASGGDAASHSPTLARHVSAAGLILGTAAYMSPEQARGRPADKRADIWSFGVVLFEMLTGRRLFTGETVTDVLAAVMRQEVPWDALPPSVPPFLRALARRCLERDVTRRLRDIGEARIAIEDAASHPEATGHVGARGGEARPPARPGLPRVVAGALALALALVAWAPWRRLPPPSPSLRLSVELGTDAPLPRTIGPAAILSPDERLLVFVAQTAAGARLLHVRRLDQALASPLPGTEGANHPFFSPDSRWIGFFAGDKLKKVAVEGGPTVTLCDAAQENRGGSWSEDGTIVFSTVAGVGSLHRVPATGGPPVEIATSPQAKAPEDARWPQVLPGGRAVLFTSGVAGNFEAASLVVQQLPSGERKVVHRGGYHGRYLPSGHLVYMHDGTLFAAPFDLERLQLAGTPVPALERVAAHQGAGGAQFAASDRGALVFLPGTDQVRAMPIVWMGKDGRTRPLRPVAAKYFVIAFSPDGSRLAVDIREGGESDIWIYEWARDALYRLTSQAGPDTSPVWSPAGRWIAFASWRGDSGTSNVCVQRADGTGDVQCLTASATPQFPTSWHPSGRFLALADSGGRRHISILELEGDEVSGWKAGKVGGLQGSAFAESEAAFSPDGRWLAYSSYETATFEVYVRPFPGPGAKVRVSTSGGRHPVWSHSRSELIYRSADNTIMVAPYTAVAGTFRVADPHRWSPADTGQPLGIEPMGPFRNFDLHPDGERVAVMTAPADETLPHHVTLILDFAEQLRGIAPTR